MVPYKPYMGPVSVWEMVHNNSVSQSWSEKPERSLEQSTIVLLTHGEDLKSNSLIFFQGLLEHASEHAYY